MYCAQTKAFTLLHGQTNANAFGSYGQKVVVVKQNCCCDTNISLIGREWVIRQTIHRHLMERTRLSSIRLSSCSGAQSIAVNTMTYGRSICRLVNGRGWSWRLESTRRLPRCNCLSRCSIRFVSLSINSIEIAAIFATDSVSVKVTTIHLAVLPMLGFWPCNDIKIWNAYLIYLSQKQSLIFKTKVKTQKTKPLTHTE